MKKAGIVLAIGLLVGLAAQAEAEWAEWRGDTYYWADDVVEPWTGNIQNFGPPGELMTLETDWWVLGPPDADPDGNDYWDAGNPDYQAGYRGEDAGACYTLYFAEPFDDGPGDEVMLRGFRGPSASGSVWASSDGTAFTQLGTIGSGTPKMFENFWFNLNGLEDVQYIKVLREADGQGSGTFFDAFGMVPEPTTALLLIFGGMFAMKRRR